MSTGSIAWTRPDLYGIESFSKEWVGANDPIDKRRHNPYTCNIRRMEQAYGSRCHYRKIQRQSISFPGDFTPNEPEWLRFHLLSKIAELIKGHGLDVGNSIGEGRQTAKMALGALKSLAAAARAVKRGDVAGAARALGAGNPKKRVTSGDISSTWLGLQYGWLPLLSDVYEAATNWEAVTNGPRKFSFVKRKRVEWDVPNILDNGGARFQGKNWYGIRCKVVITENLSQPRSLGLMDPLGVAWELTPWSFVVDWFIPISTYLDTLNVFSGLDAKVYWTTYRKGRWQHLDSYPLCDGWTGVLVQPQGFTEQIVIDRAGEQSVSVPPPKLVGFRDAMSPARIKNAIALAHQAFR